MKVRVWIILISLTIVVCSSCSNRKKEKCLMDRFQPKTSYLETSDILDTISSKYHEGRIEFPFTLLESAKFREVINNPCKYKASLISALKDENKSRVYKLVGLYSLQHLCIDDYMDVLNIVFDEYKKKNLDEAFMMSSISQDGFSLEVCKNYSTEKLQNFFKSVLPILKVDEHKKYLSDIISGRNWIEQQKYVKESAEPAPWICN